MQLSWEDIQANAIVFSKRWACVTSEKQQDQGFIEALLRVFGVEDARAVGTFQEKTRINNSTKWIDYLWKTQIAIEMKSKDENLDVAFEQLRQYMVSIPLEDVPDLWMVSDFENIRLSRRSTNETWNFKTKELRKYIRRFANIAGYTTERVRPDQFKLNGRAAEKMADLHDALKTHGYDGHDLEVYLVRLLFCLFAGDTGIFPKGNFYYYISDSKEDGSDFSHRIFDLFEVLNMPDEVRAKKPLLSNELRQFRYINGALFADRLPPAGFDAKMRKLLLECREFDWSEIHPAIFGAMFQGVMDKNKRRELGAHYTSEENILKLINPLFMDELWHEFDRVKTDPAALEYFHNKIANLKFLDPACGCGNFLIVTYGKLRELEFEVLKIKSPTNQMVMDITPMLKVNVDQFYGIEVEDFPCQIATVGMWLIDHQMNNLVADYFGIPFVRLPLKNSATIVHGNALRMNWESVVPKKELSFILGNPPFVGYSNQSDEQKADILSVYLDTKGKPFKTAGKIDYVAAWYYKAAKEIMDTQIRAAFVSTNSITQGEQVAAVWKPLFEMFGIRINFACRTFKWSNEAKGKAAVHCVIAGFNAPPSAAHPVCLSADTPLEAGNFVQSNALNSKLNFRDIRTLPYNKKLDKLANEKRKAGWLHEVVIWNKLKNKQFLGMDFYRQQIIGNFIVDFYSPNGGIVIEADGKSHEAKVEYDKERGEYLKSLELKVIHIQVKDILKNINEVLEYLKEEIKKFPASSGVPAKQAGCAAEGGAMLIYESDGTKIKAKNINPYLIDAPNIFIESRSKPLCNVPEMQKGNIPVDDGNLIIDEKDYDDFILREPKAEKFIRQLVGAEEFINNKKRYCLWLLDALPNELKQMPEVMKRIELCRKFRLDSKKEATRKSANFPARFMEIRQPESDYILIPSHSSEKREYIPIGFINKNIITTNANLTISNATLYHFGILTSSVHMAWTRAVCGRIKSDYRYSNDIVYNNFPWPDATDEQKATIEKLAQGVLDARAKFPESSLADLYDPLTMSPELVKAHKELDKAVMKLYGFGKFPASSGVPAKQAGCADEAEIVAALMERYRKYLYI